MNNKIVCFVLAAILAVFCFAGCGRNKTPDIAGKYEGTLAISGENRGLGIKGFDAEMPVYLKIDKENNFTLELGFKELNKDLNKVVDDIEGDGVYIVKDVSILGNDTYEGTVEYIDGEFVFSGDIDFTADFEDGTLTASDLFGAKTLEFN